ncbi:MAG: aminomethyl-transferring glycine dehydrogenase [Leptospirales bacterium]|nr:aminomethyl-transferring glycine dehydrogenase [Leptospirales bacterium]
MKLDLTDHYQRRHIGPGPAELQAMLRVIGVASVEELVAQTVPRSIRLDRQLELPEALSESEFLQEMRRLASKNSVYKSYIGLGVYDCITPSVIQRNIFENPGWYTQYTPYQAEISQGRLEALLNFQTMIADLTGLPVANASLLDEATAAAEAMTLLHRIRSPECVQRGAHTFFAADSCYAHTIDVLRGRAEPLGIEVVVGDASTFDPTDRFFGALLQYPSEDGSTPDYRALVGRCRARSVRVAVAADLLSLTLLAPPGEWGAEVVLGSAQRFGVAPGYGGPHAAFFAVAAEHQRAMPGRLVGVSVDAHGKPACRLALQTREQHIRREKATSNICTAQALLAIMASMYAIYHGPDGLRQISERIHGLASTLEAALSSLGFRQLNESYFDTLLVEVGADNMARLLAEAENAAVNFRIYDEQRVGISLDETVSIWDLDVIIQVFARTVGEQWGFERIEELAAAAPRRLPDTLMRNSSYLQHPVFHSHRSETQMMRYIRKLEGRDLALNQSMIPLGSCTMKLNAATAMIPLSWPEFARLHPFAPADQAHGYLEIFEDLQQYLAEITGLAAVSLQPNSGAQGEYSGLLVIRAYHRDRGEPQRNVALIPSSAHGTNPASAAMAGFEVVVAPCDSLGNIDMEQFRQRAEQYAQRLACVMVTYPSTHGVFEEQIQEVCRIVHSFGGQVYMDGANMNAQVGLTSPGRIGADVCHLNLHKTFSIPHGGGGPGMGPICVAEHLEPYLPGHVQSDRVGGERAIPAVAGAPWGSASILLISYGYIRMLGAVGVTEATRYAILNANYLKSRLQRSYDTLYAGEQGRVAHELILDLRAFKKFGIEVEDVAKRLIDYGFHAPTMSWPVPGTLMIEPTESEPREELDRFVRAMLSIRDEIQAVQEGSLDAVDNPLKNAPHTALAIAASEWTHAYSREQAAFPDAALRENKFWSPVGRVDNVYGDRNLVCSCPPVEDYVEQEFSAASAKSMH